MKRILNVDSIEKACSCKGVNYTTLASAIGVSKEAVSKWINGKSKPRPNKILKLGMFLGLGYDDLIKEVDDETTPRVAFRKKGNRKTKPEHIQRAKNMGMLLRKLAPYLPFDKFERPSTLKHPDYSYDYIQDVCLKFRGEIKKKADEVICFSDLIVKFIDLNAVIIPVFWGHKKFHENALHIYLPDSMTTWIFLNMDVNILDFKFWMAHELGHVYAPDLLEDEGEDFADAFAQTLLFPEELAKRAYSKLSKLTTKRKRINEVVSIAKEMMISPNTIIKALERYSNRHTKAFIDFGNNYYASITYLNKQYAPLSRSLYDDTPEAKDYIKKSEELFNTPFFRTLKEYLQEHDRKGSFVQQLLQVSLPDAKAIASEL